MIKPDSSVVAPAELGTVHMVGIGGSGMSGIARLFLANGITVTGSDVRDSSNIEALRELGVVVHIGHDAANVGTPKPWLSPVRCGKTILNMS